MGINWGRESKTYINIFKNLLCLKGNSSSQVSGSEIMIEALCGKYNLTQHCVYTRT